MNLSEHIPGALFKRIYIYLKPLVVDGFKMGRRKLIGLDGCHTKGLYRQQILTAVSLDGNNGWWPLAWAVVEQENMTTWNWFVNYLQQDLRIPNDSRYVFIPDKQKGLEGALHTHLPNCEHRNCVLHLYKNFQKAHRGNLLRDRIWACARASHPILFQRQMERLKDSDAFFPLTVKSDMLCNNLSESFNSFILQARDKSIITMLEIRRLCMDRIRNRKIAMERRVGLVCPRILKLLDDRYEHSRFMNIRWNGEDEYKVDAYSRIFIVNVRPLECSCRLWQLTGLPCAHSIPCICHMGKTSCDMVDPCYSKSLFVQTYSNVLHPTTSPEFWEKTNGLPLAPPNCVRLAGRPKTSRRRGADESSQSRGITSSTRRTPQHCTLCGSISHNRRTCTVEPANQTEVGSQRTSMNDAGADKGQRGGGRTRARTESTQSGPSKSKKRRTTKQQDLDRLEYFMQSMEVTYDVELDN